MGKKMSDTASSFYDEEARLRAEFADWYPNSGDRMFVASESGAVLDPLGFTTRGEPRSLTGRWYLYSEGFLHAADRLVDGCQGLPHEDELIYPMLSLYRHHLELQLKYVLRSCPGYTEELGAWLTKKHSLVALWQRIALVYPRFAEWTDSTCTDACASLIAEFDGHDPTSQGARYPTDRDGKPTLERLGVVDLHLLKRAVHKISHYLGTVIEQIGQDSEWDVEMQSW